MRFFHIATMMTSIAVMREQLQHRSPLLWLDQEVHGQTDKKKSFSHHIGLPTNGSQQAGVFSKQFSCTRNPIPCTYKQHLVLKVLWTRLQGMRSQAMCSALVPIKFAWGRGGREGDNTRSLQSGVHLLSHLHSSWRSSTGGASL